MLYDATIANKDDDEGERVEEHHAQQEVQELGPARGERAEGDALAVPRVVRVVLQMEDETLRQGEQERQHPGRLQH